MIISDNPSPSLTEFKSLMLKTDEFLNIDALQRHDYYKSRGGTSLEDDVLAALNKTARGTPFEGSIVKISGHSFPDIIADGLYGVEVKSSKLNHWTSTGGSILETTRVANIERIYMTFGKLGGRPISFLSRPYEDCLYDIAVTHSPRYLIDMKLKKGDTIFDKIGIPYDKLRNMDSPIKPITKYYRSKLRPGESLWWAGESGDEVVSPTIKLWKNIPTAEKHKYTIYGCVNYPEVFKGDYSGYALWLTSQGIVDPHIRDQFSAGGKEEMDTSDGRTVECPGVYRRIKQNKEYFLDLISLTLENERLSNEETDKRMLEWCRMASKYSPLDDDVSMDVLTTLFEIEG